MMGDQQAIDPPHVLNCKGTSAANEDPPNGHLTNRESLHHVPAADTCVLSTTFCDRLLTIGNTSHCRSAVTNHLWMLRFVSISDTVLLSLIVCLFLVWNSFLAQ